jgi:TatD DNase family protein
VWFDSHCHLFDGEREHPAPAAVARARGAGVDRMLVAGVDIATSRRAIELAAEPGVHAAAGVHPNESSGWEKASVARLRELLADPAVVAVGESGLDFFREWAPAERQRAAFAAHIALAASHGLGLVVHTRDSVDDALAMLESADSVPRVVFHCWSGDRPQLERALGLGAYVSFAGNVTFKSAAALRALVPLVPWDRLLVETDSPYLCPEPHRGRRNEPANVVVVGQAVAAARRAPVAEVAAATRANALRLFGIAQ